MAGNGSGLTTYGGTGAGTSVFRGGNDKILTPISTKTKSITYDQANNSLLLDISQSVSESASKSGQITEVRVRNDGYVPANAIFAYTRWASESDTSEAVNYVHYLLNPNEEIIIPATRAIISDDNELLDGTAVTATAPNSNEYVDSTADIDTATSGDVASDATITTIYLEDGHSNFLRVGDLIRLGYLKIVRNLLKLGILNIKRSAGDVSRTRY